MDFTSLDFTVEVAGKKTRIESFENLTVVVPHEGDLVTLKCPDSDLGE